MIDVEEQFRTEVQQLPQIMQLDLGVDADALLAAGHRVRRTRTLRRAVSGVATVLTVGLLSYGVIAHRTVAGIPEPAQAPSKMTSAPTDGTASATLELRDKKRTGPYQKIALTVTRAGNDLKTTAELYDGDGMLLATEAMLSRMDDPYGTVQMGVDPLWGMIPEVAGGISLAVEAQKGRIWSEYLVLERIGVTVYAAGFDEAADAAKLATVVWQDKDHRVHQFDDTVLSTWLVDFDGHQGYFYVEPQVDSFGYHDEGGNGFSFPLSGADAAVRFYYSGVGGNGKMEAMVVGLIPPFASDPAVTVAMPSVKWTTLDLGNRTLVVASGQSDTLAGLVKSVTYTDAKGRRITQSVKR